MICVVFGPLFDSAAACCCRSRWPPIGRGPKLPRLFHPSLYGLPEVIHPNNQHGALLSWRLLTSRIVRHERYKNQFRAMFATHIRIDQQTVVRHNDSGAKGARDMDPNEVLLARTPLALWKPDRCVCFAARTTIPSTVNPATRRWGSTTRTKSFTSSTWRLQIRECAARGGARLFTGRFLSRRHGRAQSALEPA